MEQEASAMEIVGIGVAMVDSSFWKDKKVFVTGHTGFKGSWLCLWLNLLEADVTGYALQPPTQPSLFELGKIDQLVQSIIGDVRNGVELNQAMVKTQPEIVIHLAAQPLVRDSYENPSGTYAINVMGTVNLFEAVRVCKSVRAVVNVTTDKCYENKEWLWGYRENEPLGGYDPYSSSKACSEMVTAAYRSSFFNPEHHDVHKVSLASARAGNVIGGGDWAKDRLIPDCIKSLTNKEPILIRNPNAVRPWQHVLESLSGYLILCEKQYDASRDYAEGWNFGPDEKDAKTVEYIVNRMCSLWGNGAKYIIDDGQHPHEAHYLKLDCTKAKNILGWQPRWSLDTALEKIVEWYRSYLADPKTVQAISLKQIKDYMAVDYL